MASNSIHFVMFPLMAQGHMIPMVDIAKLLAQRGIIVTIFTTPHNATRFENALSRARESNLQIRLVLLHFPTNQTGLPDGCENLDQLPSLSLSIPFFSSLALLENPTQEVCAKLTPKPNCIISDLCLPWTLNIARKLRIPWISFHGGSCFCNVVMSKIRNNSEICRRIASENEYFKVPELPDEIEITKAQLPTSNLNGSMLKFLQQIGEADMAAYGMVMNSFEELESSYAQELKKEKGNRIWCIGPVSLCNKDNVDKVQRGNTSTEDDNRWLKWLDSQEPNSVLYVCLGSLYNPTGSQLIELGLGLESSNRPFIWVIRSSSKFEKWIQEEGFEERIKERGLLIRGWAPQILILSHPAIGGFLTHCGWNSVLEGISAGLPMVTWPLFSEQFLNEKVVADLLNIAVKVGAEYPEKKMEEAEEEEEDDDGDDDEEKVVQVKKEDVREAIERVMGEGDEAEQRRKKARELGVMAMNALEDGGSSHLNITSLIDDILKDQSNWPK